VPGRNPEHFQFVQYFLYLKAPDARLILSIQRLVGAVTFNRFTLGHVEWRIG